MTITRRCAMAAGLAAVLLAGPAAAQTVTPVVFVQPSPSAINSFPVFVAIGEGYFADEGLEVRVESINGSGAVLQALAAGQAQFGRPGPGPVLAARSRGVDAVFIYNVASRSNFGLVVLEDSAVRTPADLAGKVIGTGTADGAEVAFARNILLGAGMTAGTDYTFLTVGDGGPATAAFSRGDIEAYSASSADAAILNQRGLPVREITPPEYMSYFGNGIVAMGETVRDQPELVEKFGRAFARAHAFALDDANRDTVLGHLATANPQESEDAAFASALFDVVRSKTVPIDASKGLGFQPPEAWKEWHDSLVATGDLSAPLDDLSAAYTNDFVEVWNAGLK